MENIHVGSITGLGTQEPSGHVDFYPNSGKDQPGCKDGVYQSILQEDGSLISGKLEELINVSGVSGKLNLEISVVCRDPTIHWL